jgi:hypothetical protein
VRGYGVPAPTITDKIAGSRPRERRESLSLFADAQARARRVARRLLRAAERPDERVLPAQPERNHHAHPMPCSPHPLLLTHCPRRLQLRRDATESRPRRRTLTEALSSAHVGELQGKIEITVDVSGMALNNCSSSLPSRCLQLCFRDDNCYPFVPGSGGPVFN